MSDEEREPKDDDQRAPAPDPPERSRQTTRQYPARFERVIPDPSRFETRRVPRRNEPEE